jgi:ADP-ribose pyrophosphatase YjhB (NUDIX family)
VSDADPSAAVAADADADAPDPGAESDLDTGPDGGRGPVTAADLKTVPDAGRGPDAGPVALHLGAYGLCVDAAGRLLLARMATGPDAGRWTLPGGGVEAGEHPDATLIRELYEEAGVEGVTAGPVLAIYSQTYRRPGRSIHHVGIVYGVTGVGDDLRFEQDGSTDRCEWFRRDQAAALPLVALAHFGIGLAWP